MDFPLDLNKSEFITGMDEYKQDIYVLLTEPIRNFMQSTKVGAKFDVHSSDQELVRIGVEETLKEIPGVSIVDIQVKLPEVFVVCKYFDDVINFQFSIDNENSLTNN